MELTLWNYWRSSTSFRVRLALHFKEIPFQYEPVNLLKGEHKSPEHLKRNPLKGVPVLEVKHQKGIQFLSESMAILLWLEECGLGRQDRKIFPTDAWGKAQVWSLCEMINSGVHPLQNLQVQTYVGGEDLEKRKAWAQHWTREGLKAFEKKLSETAGKFCFGDEVTAADFVLAPQLLSAERWGIDVAVEFSRLQSIAESLRILDFYKKSEPKTQIDATVG